jgi:transcriptional regulator of acetoin/glycerol metabolism
MSFFERVFSGWWRTEIVKGKVPPYQHLDPAELVPVEEQEFLAARRTLAQRVAADAILELARQGGNKRKAARALGISPTTLYRYLETGGGRDTRTMPAKVRAEVERQGGNKRAAAKALGISPTTLYRYLADAEDGGEE